MTSPTQEKAMSNQEQSAVDAAAEQAAFDEVFSNREVQAEQPHHAEEAPTEPADSKTEAPAAVVAPEDPYAGLPEPVRKALASIPTLEQELRRTTGQVRSLQSAHDRAVAEAARVAASVPVTRSEAHQRVADELPEVLETMEQLIEQRLKQAEPEKPPADSRLPDEIRLDEGFPQWREIAGSDDFKQWAAVQPDARVIQSTDDMVTFLGAITRFEKQKSAQEAIANAAQARTALRTQRIDASVTPVRGARRAASGPQTEEDAFNEYFSRER